MRKLKENKNKILLKVVFRLRNEEEFSKIEKNFKKNGYIIEEFGEIDKRNFEMEDLNSKISKLKEKYGENCKITLVSNIKDVLFVGFRLYNGIVDNFIFFIDKINYSILNNEKSDYELMAEFVDIDKENIKKKIYINIEFENFMTYFDFFVKNRNFSYFENIEKFNFNNEKICEIKTSKIKEENEENKFYEKLNENRYFIVFYIVGLLRKYEIKEVREMTVPLFKYFQDKKIEEKQIIAETIYTTKGIVFLKFKEKMAIFSLMVLLELPFNYILKLIMETMKNDNENNDKYYSAIISDIINYTAKGALMYDGFENDYKEIIKRIEKNYFKKNDIKKDNDYIPNSKKIAFIVDALFNVNYSVEKVTFDMVKNIKKYYPDYEITIFVESNFSYMLEERIMLHSFIGDSPVGSDYFSEEHNKQIEGTGVKILYSLPSANKEYRVKDMIYSIFDYNPEIILTTTLCSFSINILYNYFPTLYISLIDINGVNDFDIELYNFDIIKKKIEKCGKKLDDNMYDFRYGADFEKRNGIYKREEFNLKNEDFIMVSVGVRIEYELNEEYVDKICDFLQKYNNAKWIIIGGKSFPYIEKKYYELLKEKICIIEFENNLSDFYQICDICLNPPRDGGGFSILQAIVNELPVVCLSDSESGKAYVGEENCLKNLTEYYNEIEKLYNNKEYHREKIDAEKEVIKKYEYSEVIKKLIYYIGKAKENYKKRKLL